MKYCRNCKQNVEPGKKFSWGLFILFLGIFYLLYFMFMKKKTCPMCNSRNFEHKHSNKELLKADNIQVVNTPEEPSNLDSWATKVSENSKKTNEQYAIAKAKTVETLRKRKAGELPWQIKNAERKQNKIDKKINKTQ